MVPASAAVTNMHGYFIVPNQSAGRYRLCVEADGYVSTCDPKLISLSNGTLVLDHDVVIAPRARILRGRVQLKDGQIPYQENQFFRTLVTTEVTLLDGSGKVASGPVSANSLGLYVLPHITAAGPYTIKATYAASVVTRAVTATADTFTGAASLDLTFENSAPKIAYVIATDGGKAVRRALPGATVKAEVRASDPDGDPLHYKWADESGSVGVDASTIDWKLPNVPGPRVLDVEVNDGKGGFARGHLMVVVGNGVGEFFNGIVTNRQSHAPIAGASVSINGKSIKTGANGAFGITMPEADRYVINVRAPQYALKSQIFYAGTTGMNLQLDHAQRRVCNDPLVLCRATAEQRTLSAIEISPGTLVDSGGNVVKTPVSVDIHGYDLTQANAIPGDYGALLKSGRAATMESYGAIDVQISDGGGNRYELAPGKTAHIRIGVDPSELAHAPATIPLLSYDETSGYWKEEGEARLVGNAYEADVSHFTAWNADSVFSGTACIAIHVQDQPPNFAPPFPFRLHGDIPTSPGLFRHPDFTATSAPFALYRLPPNSTVTIEVHTNSGPDFPSPPSFTVNSGAAIDPIYEASPFNGVPPLYALDTACHGSLNIAIPLPTHAVPWLNVPSAPCDITTSACDAETVEYYKAVGALDTAGNPTAARGTFNAWKTTNHLSTDPTAPAAGEVEAIFYNNADLQFGRDMHCKQNGQDVACYVSNYSSTGLAGGPDQDAIHLAEAVPRHPIASVAMEYDHTLGANGVRFYVFHADLANNDGTLFKNPALDSEGGKYTPWLCLACHGGAYNATPHNVENASFLPFDVPSYKQDLNLASIFSEPNQREAFGALNALVQATHPNSTNPHDPVGNLITQWYQWCGGPGAGGCTIDDVGHPYVPPPPAPGWPGQADLYKKIPRLYCRTCHVAQGSTSSPYPDWTQYSDFNSPSYLKNVVCTARAMPHAEVPFKAFWLSADPHAPAYLSTSIGISGGCPP